jgi:hypothetical protein
MTAMGRKNRLLRTTGMGAGHVVTIQTRLAPVGHAAAIRTHDKLRDSKEHVRIAQSEIVFKHCFLIESRSCPSAFVHVHAGPNRDPDKTQRTKENG